MFWKISASESTEINLSNMPFGIDDIDVVHINDILSSYKKISGAILFGSRAKGTFRPGSDIDIALKGPDLKLNDIIELNILFDELLLPYKFDLIIFDKISEDALLNHIKRVGVILY